MAGKTTNANRISKVIQEVSKSSTGVKKTNELIKKTQELLGKNVDAKFLKKFNFAIVESQSKVQDFLEKTSSVLTKVSLGITAFATAIYYTIKKVWNFTLKYTEQSSAYIENLHLFEVSLGKVEDAYGRLDEKASKYYTKGMEFQKTMHERFGTNMSDTMKFQALFNQMATAMEIPEEQAYELSEGFTKLGYDLSSLYNISSEDAMERLRAGLAGQTKPLRGVALDITQQSLAPKLQELGIDRSVKQLSQAEKMALRYIVVMEQATNVNGDFAKTIETPANQLKVLSTQMKELAIAIGNMFLPMLNQVLPYINGFVMALKETIQFIAVFLGYTTDMGNGLSGALDDAEVDLGFDDELADAKKLKSFVTGIDELNILNSKEDEEASALGGIDPRLLEAMKSYENGMEAVRMKALDIRDAMLEWLGFELEFDENGNLIDLEYLDEGYTGLEKIRDIMLVIAGIKIASGIMSMLAGIGRGILLLTELKKWWALNKVAVLAVAKSIVTIITKILGVIAVVIGLKMYIDEMIEVFKTGEMEMSDLFKMLGALALVCVGIIAVLGISVGGTVALVAGLIGAIGILVTAVYSKWNEIVYWSKMCVINIKDFIVTTALKILIWITEKIGTTVAGIYLTGKETIMNIVIFFKEKFYNVLEWIETQINKLIGKINEALAFFGLDTIGEIDITTKLGEDIEKMKQERDNLKNLEPEDLKNAVVDGLKETLNNYNEKADDQRMEAYMDYVLAEKEKAEKNAKNKEAEEAEKETNKLMEAFGGLGDTIKNLQASMETASAVPEQEEKAEETSKADEYMASIMSDNNLLAVEEVETSESIADNTEYANNLAVESNNNTHSIYMILKNEIISKLQQIKTACENIRINITNNYYGGGGGKATGYATGGMPQKASLFYAHENGIPELVGRMGTNTAVMNNEQIVDAVSRGVAEAVAGSIGRKKISVEIDGRELLSATEKAKSRRGYGIVGGAFAKG